MVEPCFFALTSTPSIGPSRSDATVPLSAGGAPCARTDPAEKASHAATAEAAIRANSRGGMRSSRSKVRSGADNVNAINIQIGVEGDHETSKTAFDWARLHVLQAEPLPYGATHARRSYRSHFICRRHCHHGRSGRAELVRD